MLEEYQQERIDFIKNILPYFGGEFILKSGTALSLYYGLNRYSEDLDFDCLTSNMNCINRLKQCKDFNKWNISIKKILIWFLDL
ncbi:nucleotidyl transferase AbiEii/AbiGii toxin family protein [Campylobacter devanensis]|uniref:nucleotidyl transferase AbiEii/AbiGii toxin family protein n=1 Tax=Campylobacter devanensis TaxID=3161138 RepID=UPI00235138E2|nr:MULTISPECIES: nucleotidyl transferase AbiEii/AbiGii toxin family protein [unclassified Campylobacter]